MLVPPAGRAEILVTGPTRPFYLVSLCYDAGPNGDVNPWAILGELVDDRWATNSPRIAAPLGLRVAEHYRSVPAPAVRRLIHLQEDAKGFYIDKVAYRPSSPVAIVARAGTVEEWVLENDTDEVHTFHVHQVHFVVESRDGVAERLPHWLDVVDVPPQRRVKLLVDFRDPAARGTFLLHCHIVDHEDGGMMAKIAVI